VLGEEFPPFSLLRNPCSSRQVTDSGPAPCNIFYCFSCRGCSPATQEEIFLHRNINIILLFFTEHTFQIKNKQKITPSFGPAAGAADGRNAPCAETAGTPAQTAAGSLCVRNQVPIRALWVVCVRPNLSPGGLHHKHACEGRVNATENLAAVPGWIFILILHSFSFLVYCFCVFGFTLCRSLSATFPKYRLHASLLDACLGFLSVFLFLAEVFVIYRYPGRLCNWSCVRLPSCLSTFPGSWLLAWISVRCA